MKIAVLDDYQNVALAMADWSQVEARASVTVFNDHVSDADALVERLAPFDVLCVMRERTPLPAALIVRLDRLKLIVSTGARNASIDVDAARSQGIEIAATGYQASPTIELTWALILASARHITAENAAVRSGGWQRTVGSDLDGKALGVLGLGTIGSRVAAIGKAFGMEVIAWSPNLTEARAAEAGARLVSKTELFETSDFLTIHMVLSHRSRGLVADADLRRMKPTSFLVNTSRGPLVDEAALIEALRGERIAGAALDVFDEEPLPAGHPFRSLHNVLATPHIGYVSESVYRIFYRDTVAGILAWLSRQPV